MRIGSSRHKSTKYGKTGVKGYILESSDDWCMAGLPLDLKPVESCVESLVFAVSL